MDLPTLSVAEVHARDNWNESLRQLPNAHILQSWDWGDFKQATGGWRPTRLAFKRDGELAAMASVSLRKLGPFKVMVVSKGPALDYADADLAEAVIMELEARAAAQGAVWLKIDPDVVAATGLPGSENERICKIGSSLATMLARRGWAFSPSQVQYRNTIIIDLQPTEAEILMAMSGNTRRKIRSAVKKGVSVRPGALDDLPLLYQLYQTTAERDDFLIRPFDYYRRAWAAFMRAGLAQALIAEVKSQPIAHVILFHFGATCFYFYGASANAERQRMPNYLLQWEAIKWAKARGCRRYDLWGAPDVFDESDSLWGVYQFKRGFRGDLTRHIGAWDYAPRPLLYRAYNSIMPRLMRLT